MWLVVTTAGGALGVAVTALWFALSRGRSMLGRSPRWLLYGIARGSLPIILANGMTAIQVLMILALKLSGVRRRKEVK